MAASVTASLTLYPYSLFNDKGNMIQCSTEHYNSVVIDSVIYKILMSHSIFTMLSTLQHSFH